MPAAHRRRPSAPALTRRSAVASLALGLTGVAAGCDPDHGAGERSPGVSGTSASTGGADPDVDLTDRVRRELGDLLALVSAAGARFGSLEHELRPFRELHRAHLAALDASAPNASVPGPELPRSPAAAMRAVLARERSGQARLADAAVAAASGVLARLLASMSAGMAQRLAVTTGPSRAASA